MESRKLVLKRMEGSGDIALHDAETGQVIAGQMSVNIVQLPFEQSKVAVEFYVGGDDWMVGTKIND